MIIIDILFPKLQSDKLLSEEVKKICPKSVRNFV